MLIVTCLVFTLALSYFLYETRVLTYVVNCYRNSEILQVDTSAIIGKHLASFLCQHNVAYETQRAKQARYNKFYQFLADYSF